jgi:uncharacterized protein (DUF885 family)
MTALSLTSSMQAEPAEDAKLVAFFHRYLETEMKHQPTLATRLGDHRYDHLLDDLSPRARREADERARHTLGEMRKEINYAKLSRSSQIDFEILEHDLKRSLWISEHVKPYERDPRTYIEAISDSVYTLLTQSTLSKERAIQSAVGRITQIPHVVAAAKESLKDAPRIWVEVAIKQNRGAISFYEKGIFEITGETQGSQLHSACRKILPALHEFQEFLEKHLLPKSTGDWRLGKALFAEKLALELDANMSAEEVIRDAEAEATRVEYEMVVIARQLWSHYFPNKPLPPDDPAGRHELVAAVIASVSHEHGNVQDLVRDAHATVAQVKRFIAEHDIIRLPDPDHCQVIEMPEFQRGFSVAYLNPAPPLDPNAASHYAVSPPPRDWDERRVESYLEEYNRHMLQILTIHEGYPGHYVQLEYGNRHPSMIRRVLYSGVFAEGWAVYTEQMMLDQGYGDGNLALRLCQLKFYLRTVINAILDHRMHCDGMTDEAAKALLMDRGFQSEGEALGKIQRAKLSSCQLSTYFVGRMAFYRLRQAIEREQGAAFNLGRYHEAVLSHGTLPVKYLPELMHTK